VLKQHIIASDVTDKRQRGKLKNVDMNVEKRADDSHTKQCYSYATCVNLSKADAKSTRNE